MSRTTETFATQISPFLSSFSKENPRSTGDSAKKKNREVKKRKRGESRSVSLLTSSNVPDTLVSSARGTGRESFWCVRAAGGSADRARPMTWCGALGPRGGVSIPARATNGRACAGRRRGDRRAALRRERYSATLGRGRHGPIAVNNSGTVERFTRHYGLAGELRQRRRQQQRFGRREGELARRGGRARSPFAVGDDVGVTRRGRSGAHRSTWPRYAYRPTPRFARL